MPKKLVLLLSAVLAVPLLIYLLFLFIERPRYIVLNIASPDSHLPRGGWYTTEYVVEERSDTYAKIYIWRREGRAEADKYPSWQDVSSYFDSWLTTNGWLLHPSPQFSSCQVWLGEVKFLEPGIGGYLVYFQEGRDPFEETPLVCLAIFPYSYSGEVQGYEVILVTANPSPFTRFLHDM